MLRRTFGMIGAALMAGAMSLFGGAPINLEPLRSPPRRPRRHLSPSVHYFPRGKFYTPNGKREVARRLRQIAAGQLRVSQ